MKSTLIAYLLWFFLGGAGIHKFYLKNNKMGILYLALTIAGVFTVTFIFGFAFFGILAIFMIIDLFTIPKQVAEANKTIAN